MRRKISGVLIASLVLVACARQTRLESGGDVDLAVTPADSRTLPSGTVISATLDQEIGTKANKVGDTFTATVERAVIAQNGETVVPAGAKLYGKVTGLDNSDHIGESAAIKIDFETMNVRGNSYPFGAKVTATNLETRGGDTRRETIQKAGVGAAAGAVLGAILSGGEIDDILKGGIIGAAAGTVISLGTSSTEAVLPAGTRMTLQTTRTVALR